MERDWNVAKSGRLGVISIQSVATGWPPNFANKSTFLVPCRLIPQEQFITGPG
jgi:hypothetical protein